MRILVSLAAAAGLTAGVALAQGSALPLTRIIGVVGIGGGQSARLNVLNPGVGAPFLGVRCTATLSFFNDQGQQLTTTTVIIDPGKSAPLDLPASGTGDRVEVYGLVSTPPIGVQPNVGYCTLVPTIEVIDSAGNTVAVLTQSMVRPPAPAGATTPSTPPGNDQ